MHTAESDGNNKNRQTTAIVVALILGVAVGWLCNRVAADQAQAKEIASYFAMLSDIFLRMIKMIIAPLIFSTLVAGLAGMGDGRSVGRIGGRALGWFLMASFASLGIGLAFANLLQPGAHVGIPLPATGAEVGLKTSALNLKDFLAHVFPRNIFEALANNEILQILVFSLFFGVALAQLRDTRAGTLVKVIEEAVPVMLKLTGYVMFFAPLGVFAAVANVVTTQGLGILLVYGKFVSFFYVALFALWVFLVAAGWVVLRDRIFPLLGAVRQPMILGFSTASSEAAYPRVMDRLAAFGVSQRIIGFVLPLGYSFNLDGSMIYTTFASLFVAQAYGIDMPFSEQLTMMLVLMVSSKGIAGVPRSALVVVAAVLPTFHLPEAGVLLIMGIDVFLDMGRTATNVLGNSIATAVVAHWEGELAPSGEDADDDDAGAPELAEAYGAAE